jgi:hypothetical protein
VIVLITPLVFVAKRCFWRHNYLFLELRSVRRSDCFGVIGVAMQPVGGALSRRGVAGQRLRVAGTEVRTAFGPRGETRLNGQYSAVLSAAG